MKHLMNGIQYMKNQHSIRDIESHITQYIDQLDIEVIAKKAGFKQYELEYSDKLPLYRDFSIRMSALVLKLIADEQKKPDVLRKDDLIQVNIST